MFLNFINRTPINLLMNGPKETAFRLLIHLVYRSLIAAHVINKSVEIVVAFRLFCDIAALFNFCCDPLRHLFAKCCPQTLILSKRGSHRQRMGLRPGVNFINVLPAHFLYKILAPKATKLGLKFWCQNFLYKKCTRKMLMKLTP